MAKNSIIRKGTCINVVDCENAKTKEIIDVNIGEDFICPKCKGMLVDVPTKPSVPMWLIICLAVLILGGGGAAAYFLLFNGEKEPSSTTKTPTEILISSISVNGVTPVEVKEGNQVQIEISILPENATNTQVEWISSDPGIVAIDGGIIKGIKKGDATITVNALDESSKSVSFDVRVIKADTGKDGGNSGGNGGNTSIPVPGGTYKGETKNGQPHGNGTITYSKRTLIDDLKQRYAEPGDYVTGLFREGKIQNVKWYSSSDEFKATIIP